ncbi:M56 family metallopeptidase [Streptomyces tanashiensis]
MHTLTPAQLAAALAHERAHIAGRHHLLVAAAEAFAAVFPRLPLARHGGSAVPLLLEMAADEPGVAPLHPGRARDGAVRPGLGPGAAVGVRRGRPLGGAADAAPILTPYSAGHPVLRGLLTIAAAALAMAPLIVACCSFPQ